MGERLKGVVHALRALNRRAGKRVKVAERAERSGCTQRWVGEEAQRGGTLRWVGKRLKRADAFRASNGGIGEH